MLFKLESGKVCEGSIRNVQSCSWLKWSQYYFKPKMENQFHVSCIKSQRHILHLKDLQELKILNFVSAAGRGIQNKDWLKKGGERGIDRLGQNTNLRVRYLKIIKQGSGKLPVTLTLLIAPSVQCPAVTYRIHQMRHIQEQHKNPTITHVSFSSRNYG